jgi:tetratricopeptide (TPR) repeat protein
LSKVRTDALRQLFRLVSLPIGLVFLLVTAAGACAAEDANPYRTALDYRYNLQYDQARKTLEDWLVQHPNDLHALNGLATVELHREMFHQGILASHIYGDLGGMFRTGKIPYPPEFQKQLFDLLAKAQSLAEARLQRNPKDQEALYWEGAAHATRAVFYFTMAKSYLAALHEATAARKAHQQLLTINPGFTDAWLVVGTNDYVIGCLPWYLKVFTSLAGYHGNRARGIAEVQRVAAQGNWAKEDAKLVLAVLYRREEMYPQTLRELQDLAQSYPRNFLLEREIAGIYQVEGKLPAAARVYDELVSRLETHQPGYEQMPAARILYEAGQIHAQLGETETALARFQQAARLPANDVYVYRAQLAAANLEVQLHHQAAAIQGYKRVAEAIPDTDEGKAARSALRRLPEGDPAK